MSINREKVSVIIPVYNCADFLAEAIESVLAQTHPASEIIVVDDGSTDESASVAGRFAPDVRVLKQANEGPGPARNLGVREAHGSYLAFLDADDVWLPEKTERQMQAMDSAGLDMVFGRVEIFRDGESDAGSAPRIHEGMLVGAMLIRREAFDRVGEFATTWRIGEFIDWYARALQCGLRSLCLPEMVMRRRLHAHNLTKTSENREVYLDVLRAAVARRKDAEKRE